MPPGFSRIPIVCIVGHVVSFCLFARLGLSPSDDGFHKIVSSLSVALTSQARASYAAASFLKQVQRETYVAHLLPHMHDSVKHALLSTPSVDSLFSEDVIQLLLGQVRDDTQLQLLRNLSSQKSDKVSSSSTSSSFQRRCRSPGPQRSPSSSSRDSQFSLAVRGARSALLLLLQRIVVRQNAFQSRLPRRGRIFASRSYVPRLLW